MNITLLPDTFQGTGEVSEFTFRKKRASVFALVYEVLYEDKPTHYEVFRLRSVPMCIDFDNRIYSDVDYKEVYPKAKDFGVWAWTFKTLKEALNKFEEINSCGEEKASE